jgi:hypothetical protein
MHGQCRGFYLVRASDGQRRFIANAVDGIALQRSCERHLNDAVGWDCWIDSSYGLDVHGNRPGPTSIRPIGSSNKSGPSKEGLPMPFQGIGKSILQHRICGERTT